MKFICLNVDWAKCGRKILRRNQVEFGDPNFENKKYCIVYPTLEDRGRCRYNITDHDSSTACGKDRQHNAKTGKRILKGEEKDAVTCFRVVIKLPSASLWKSRKYQDGILDDRNAEAIRCKHCKSNVRPISEDTGDFKGPSPWSLAKDVEYICKSGGHLFLACKFKDKKIAPIGSCSRFGEVRCGTTKCDFRGTKEEHNAHKEARQMDIPGDGFNNECASSSFTGMVEAGAPNDVGFGKKDDKRANGVAGIRCNECKGYVVKASRRRLISPIMNRLSQSEDML